MGEHCVPVMAEAPAPESMKTLFFSRVTCETARATEEVGTSRIEVDAVLVVPLTRDVRADVRLVLMVGRDDVDIDALVGGLEILDRHVGRDHRAFSAEIGVDAGAIVENADLDGNVRGARRGPRNATIAAARSVLLPASSFFLAAVRGLTT